MWYILFLAIWIILGVLSLARFNASEKVLDPRVKISDDTKFVFAIGGLIGLIFGFIYYNNNQKMFDFKF